MATQRLVSRSLVGLAFALAVLVCVPSSQAGETAEDLLLRAKALASRGDSKGALKLLDQILIKDSTLKSAHYIRGRERFRVGQIKESVEDFDKYVKLRPDLASRQWERGIALYYAGKFKEGAKQFEDYQTYHDNDVENSVWRYLCVARASDTTTARKTMLPIRDDRRVPMMQIFDLYRGKLGPGDVLKELRKGEPDSSQRKASRFYADLYLGLYYESQGKKARARLHITQAADPSLRDNPGLNSYMWDVARIHANLLRKEQFDAGKKKPDPTSIDSSKRPRNSDP